MIKQNITKPFMNLFFYIIIYTQYQNKISFFQGIYSAGT